ncbi:patatin-like phospholipase family protein [Arcicella sp. LKC2W]|uniref:patatin-like phospholipase family protein n=1 Tax=Arcicella sp. LKC2W TaxID=2984198 RepID=UPI002B1FA80E|nr:patatin-like phospholipase family protein [Arcicella sp. LKC2W]MEA5458780.1 patatin-like phospholipase family protein [Arcicella sp. LKC2W]
MSKILVLAGGSVKGAYQAGVVRAVFESGFRPDAIYGISAGSMNASYLVNDFGLQFMNNNGSVDYAQSSVDLCDFWINNINTPDSLALRRGTYDLGMSAIRRNFEGLLDTTPLREILHNNIHLRNLNASPIQLKVGAVDIINGSIVYADPTYDHFLDYIMASSAIPILMPVVNIGGLRKMAFLDGGMRDVAPIKKAISDGATEIICIACHTRNIDGGYFPYGNLLALVDRVMDIAVNECLNADLDWAEFRNECLPIDGSEGEFGILKGQKRINLKIIRPHKTLNIDIQDFDQEDIQRLIFLGYQQGREEMKSIT